MSKRGLTEEEKKRAAATREVRDRLGVTQEQMGKLIGKRANSIGEYEREIRPVGDTEWKLIQLERLRLGIIG